MGMNAVQMAGALSVRLRDHWGVTGPFQGQIQRHISGRYLRVWLSNGHGLVVRDNETGGVDVLHIIHVPGAREAVWTSVFKGSDSVWHTNVTVDQAAAVINAFRELPGQMAPIDYARA